MNLVIPTPTTYAFLDIFDNYYDVKYLIPFITLLIPINIHCQQPSYIIALTEYNSYLNNKKMSQWKLPVIDSKKQFSEEDDYNFVNKDKKKSKDQSGALSMIQQLKSKIEEQKKEIQNRNATIMGLQRNFQSLSAIVKNQKAQSAALKAELQNLRQNSEIGDKRAVEFHEKCILLQNQNKMLKQQLANIKRAHLDCSKIAIQSQTYKNKIIQLQAVIQKYSQKLDILSQQKKSLQQQLSRTRGQQKSKRQLQERIVDLEQELKRNMDYVNGLNDKLKMQEDKLHDAKSSTSVSQGKINQLLRKLKEQEGRRRAVESESQLLRKEARDRNKEVEDLKKNADSMDLYSKMRTEQEQKFKQQLKSAKIKNEQYRQQIQKLNQQIKQLQREAANTVEMIKVSEKQLEILRTQNNKIRAEFKQKEDKYLSEVDKLTKWVGQLNKQLDVSQGRYKELDSKLHAEVNERSSAGSRLKGLQQQLQNLNTKMQSTQNYTKYYKQIDEHEKKGIIITNIQQMEKITKGASTMADKLNATIDEYKNSIDQLTQDNAAMKKYISSMETEVNLKTKEINQKNKAIRSYEDRLDALSHEEKKLAETIAEERRKTEQFKKQFEEVKLKSQKQIEEERQQSQKKIEEQQEKARRYKKMVDQYQQEQQKLKKLMSKQQDQIKQLAKNKEDEISQIIKQKQMEIEKERKNNKLLWTDNKKLKDMEQRMRDEALKQIQQVQNRKKLEIQKLKRELEKRYQQEFNMQKEEQSNSNELKKILNQKAQQIKIITENHTKAKNQLQFYKNRNKQLQGVVSRTEKAFKDQLATLQKEVKTNKEVIGVLDKKNTEINLVKQEIERKAKTDIEKLTEQLQYLKQKYEGQKIQQKIALLKKSMGEFEATLKAIGNSLSCNYCLEPVKQCIRLRECGHIYCKKCKAGYQPNCGECKKASVEMPDKVLDDTISKTEYMKIIINTVKEDMRQISL